MQLLQRLNTRRPGGRWTVLTALLAALAVVITGCGSSDSESSSGESYTVEHAMGSTEIHGVPERIVVLDSPMLDALIALGLKPVGAPEIGKGRSFPGYLADKLDGVTSIGTISAPDIDKIANLAPDLIIGSKVRHEEVYDELSAIAPTVFSDDSGTNWHEQAELTAAAVRRTDEMNALLAGVDERAAQVGEEVGAKGTTVSIVRFRSDNFRLYGPGTFSGSILSTMGFTFDDRDWNEYSMAELSPELYEQINGDVIFHTSPGGDPNATTEKTITGMWSGLPAVKANKAFGVDDDTWMVGIGVIGAGLVIDQVDQLLG